MAWMLRNMKGYVLTLLFVKYVIDKAKSNKNSLIDVPIGGAFDDLALSAGEATANTKLKAEQENLMEKGFQQYANLTENDIKTLMVDDKWLAIPAAAAHRRGGFARQPRGGTSQKDGI
jgi:hypothetical protein